MLCSQAALLLRDAAVGEADVDLQLVNSNTSSAGGSGQGGQRAAGQADIPPPRLPSPKRKPKKIKTDEELLLQKLQQVPW